MPIHDGVVGWWIVGFGRSSSGLVDDSTGYHRRSPAKVWVECGGDEVQHLLSRCVGGEGGIGVGVCRNVPILGCGSVVVGKSEE
jgi:hypothetical protein